MTNHLFLDSAEFDVEKSLGYVFCRVPRLRDALDTTSQQSCIEIKAAALWLAVNVQKVSRKTKHLRTAYGIKHVYEDATGTYVDQEQFACAAVLAGFDVWNPRNGVAPSGRPHCYLINANPRDLDYIRWQTSQRHRFRNVIKLTDTPQHHSPVSDHSRTMPV